MKTRIFSSLAMGSLLACQPLSAQVLPNIGNTVEQTVQTSVERQVERAQNAAVDRAVEQAEAAAASQVLERAEAVQAELVQNQTLEQVQNQVERVQSQAAEQAQTQIERVQAQAAEQAQTQIERVQEQATGQAQSTVERVHAQVESAAGQIEQVQSRLDQLPAQAAEQVQDKVPEYVPAIAAQVGIDRAVEAAGGAAAGTVAAAVPESAPAPAGNPDAPTGGDNGNPPAATADATRQTVNAADGSAAFVEITLPDGARAVEFEWVMIVTPDERARLDGEAAELLSYLTDTTPFALADDGQLLTFTVPPDLDANDAILDLVPDNMRDLIDRNHIYDTQDDDKGSAPVATPAQLTLPMPAVCPAPVKLGMIDSSINTAHPAFAASGAVITQRSFVDAELPQMTSHGTSVAGLLVGRDDSGQSGMALHPLLPAAALYSASVFHANDGATQGATVMRILSALDWLLEQEDVKVINMSLAGPPNRLLARAVSAASAKGRVIVAAAGNDGPYGPVRYPAGYDEVIGVTAVTRDTGIFRFANQGPHIDYAALGVDVPTARGDGSFGSESGTSLAAPVIAAFIACELVQHGDVQQALAALDARVHDLGAPGADPVYGRGLLHPLP
jgi:minor extracellular protease Epr